MKNKREFLNEEFSDLTLLFADDLDDAIIGIAYNKSSGEYVVVYSRTKCIDILIQRDNMKYEEASEFFDFNIEGAYVGKKTPIWVDDEMIECDCDNKKGCCK